MLQIEIGAAERDHDQHQQHQRVDGGFRIFLAPFDRARRLLRRGLARSLGHGLARRLRRRGPVQGLARLAHALLAAAGRLLAGLLRFAGSLCHGVSPFGVLTCWHSNSGARSAESANFVQTTAATGPVAEPILRRPVAENTARQLFVRLWYEIMAIKSYCSMFYMMINKTID